MTTRTNPRTSRQLTRTAYDCPSVKATAAIGLLFDGRHTGSIVAGWSNNAAGVVCRVTVTVQAGPLAGLETSGKSDADGAASGKLAAALFDAMTRAGQTANIATWTDTDDALAHFEAIGYVCVRVLG